MFLAEWLFCSAERRAPRSHSFSGPCVAPLGPARAPPPVPGARAPKPPKPSFRPSRRPAPSPWGLGAPTSPSERPSEAREPPISPGGPPAAPPAGPFNGHIKRAVGVGRSGRVPLHPGRLGWGGGGQNRAKYGGQSGRRLTAPAPKLAKSGTALHHWGPPEPRHQCPAPGHPNPPNPRSAHPADRPHRPGGWGHQLAHRNGPQRRGSRRSRRAGLPRPLRQAHLTAI